MWESTIMHQGLNAYRVVRGQTQEELSTKATLQLALWDQRWARKLEVDRSRQSRASQIHQRHLKTANVLAAKAVALEQTKELEAQREVLSKLLIVSWRKGTRLDWNSLKDTSDFAVAPPTMSAPLPLPSKPSPTDSSYAPQTVMLELSYLQRIIPALRKKKMMATKELAAKADSEAHSRFARALQEWEVEAERVNRCNEQSEKAFQLAHQRWKDEKRSFEFRQSEANAAADDYKKQYMAGERTAILAYFHDVLSCSEYPDAFPREYVCGLVEETKTLVIDCELPNQSALGTVKEIKYVVARAEFQEVLLAKTWISKTYDEVLYQIALRTIYELFNSDMINAVTSVVFNGWVRSVDKGTGAEAHACVMSLEAGKDEFLAIDLSLVDPKVCFRRLKGVSASKLIELSPVRPLVDLNREDKRFVAGYEVVESIDQRTNLAAMDWLDFENLIRELFEKEFSRSGGEVKITQASRDGGVDAIALDPDPIRGGKIVIQAKRYTNTVGVSAVRDLYGTVHNEGANKGILVTTSDFGPDAYEFAKGKPLTLLSGSELLYLLGKHGHGAKIDLAEAKRLFAESAK